MNHTFLIFLRLHEREPGVVSVSDDTNVPGGFLRTLEYQVQDKDMIGSAILSVCMEIAGGVNRELLGVGGFRYIMDTSLAAPLVPYGHPEPVVPVVP